MVYIQRRHEAINYFSDGDLIAKYGILERPFSTFILGLIDF
jgi:hypothetical protein